MVTKSKLKMALAAEKGTDFKALKEKKKHKAALKEKAAKEAAASGAPGQDKEEDEEDEDDIDDADDVDDGDEEELNRINLGAIDDSDSSESSIELEKRIETRPKKSNLKVNGKASANAGANSDSEDEEEDEENIPISDLESLADSDKEDLIPHTRLTINNTPALLSALNRISFRTDSSVPFVTHQSVTSETPTADSIPDVSDDLQRELAFYSQSLAAVTVARTKLIAEGVPFSRPKDYFAEMVKEDAHMDKIKAKLVEEASNKKAAAEARKQRDLKKFGKAVQVAKMQERQKEKRETLDKIKSLKRKRAESNNEVGTTEADLFDVGVESELSKPSSRSGSGRKPTAAGRGGSHKANPKRQQKNEKYGFGGKKRHGKSGDAMSSGDLSGFDPKRMKAGSGKPQRPGKARRKAMKS